MFKEGSAQKMCSSWEVLAVLLKAKVRMKVIVKEMHASVKEPMLYFCLFPRDYVFERDTLVQLWSAGGLFESEHLEVVSQHMRRHRDQLLVEPEDVGYFCFDILVKQKYLLPSTFDHLNKKRNYTVNPDKLKAFLDRIPAIEKKLYTRIEDENVVADQVLRSSHVSLTSDCISKETFEKLKNCGNLRSLLLLQNYGSSLKEVPSSIFLVHRTLHTLDLSGSHITKLPSSIGDVTQLCYLDLSFTLIDGLPDSIDRLHKLQTLKLQGCKNIFTLPKGLKKLVSLRHLDFDVLGQLSSMPRGIEALTELRTLSAFIVDDENGCNIQELRSLNNLSGSCCISELENANEEAAKQAALINKKYLTKLQLRWTPSALKATPDQHDALMVIQNLKPSSCLEELHVRCYPGLVLPAWLGDEHFGKLVSIGLLKCDNVQLHNTLGGLPNLKYLDVTQMNRVSTIDSMFRGDGIVAFPKLEKLTIDGMLCLETWIGVETNDFPLLSELIVKHCPKLHEIPFLPFLQSLKHLEIVGCKSLTSLTNGKLSASVETLIIDDCPLLKDNYSEGGADWYKIDHVNDICIHLDDMQLNVSDYDSTDLEDSTELEDSDSDVSEIRMDKEGSLVDHEGSESPEEQLEMEVLLSGPPIEESPTDMIAETHRLQTDVKDVAPDVYSRISEPDKGKSLVGHNMSDNIKGKGQVLKHEGSSQGETHHHDYQIEQRQHVAPLSRYESQKRRDWNTFCQYLKNQRPPVSNISQCTPNHVLDFLRYLDQFGKTKVHIHGCLFFGLPQQPGPCACPLRQAWGSLDALIGRLKVAYEENGGSPDTNPFASGNISIYLREVRDSQAEARGVTYQKNKKRKTILLGERVKEGARPEHLS